MALIGENRRTAVVHLVQNVSPCVLPSFLRLRIPVVTTLHFRETEPDSGLLKIYRQEDSWTLEGIKSTTFDSKVLMSLE